MTTPHPNADMLRAIADGKQMQELDFTGINHPGNWCDCDADRALNRISRGVEQYVRIKPETVTINGIECPAPMRVAPAAQPPAGFVMVPTELAERVQETMGEFLMDHGWRQIDMDTSDALDAVLAAAPKAAPAPAAQKNALNNHNVHEPTAIGCAVNRAARDLPEGWEIRIDLERGAGVVHLTDPEGNETMIDGGGELFSDQINAAIDVATEEKQ